MRAGVQFILFQLGWFACVLGAANGRALLGPVVVALVLLVHFLVFRAPSRELAVISGGALVGSVLDSTLMNAGLLTYASNGTPLWFAPWWDCALWLGFGTTLSPDSGSLAWLRARPVTAASMGAVFGPLAYFAGARLGAIELSHRGSALLAVALVWGIVLPVWAQFMGKQAKTTNANGAP